MTDGNFVDQFCDSLIAQEESEEAIRAAKAAPSSIRGKTLPAAAWLFEQLKTGKTMDDLAAEIGSVPASIRKKLEKHGFKISDINKAVRGEDGRGRPRKTTDVAELEDMRSQGLSVHQIGAKIGCSRSTVSRMLKDGFPNEHPLRKRVPTPYHIVTDWAEVFQTSPHVQQVIIDSRDALISSVQSLYRLDDNGRVDVKALPAIARAIDAACKLDALLLPALREMQ